MWNNGTGRLTLSVFGESHGPAVGCVLAGLPAGEPLDEAAIAAQMARRAPGQDPSATARREPDTFTVLSGVMDGHTTGAPLAITIANRDVRDEDYAALADAPRPGHADYGACLKYHGFNDPRGGGHFSGRLTAPLVFAGAVCRQLLARRGVTVGGHIARIGDVMDTPLDPLRVDETQLRQLAAAYFPLADLSRQDEMRRVIEAARAAGDSVGGVVEIAAVGLPVGLGGPLFEGLDGRLAAALMGIPGIKGVEFGDGFASASYRGSQVNDSPTYVDDRVEWLSNHSGGIVGGMTNGAPLIVRAAVRPTASVACAQPTIDRRTRQNVTVHVTGRHDPCFVPRVVPAAEAAVAVTLLDAWLSEERRP